MSNTPQITREHALLDNINDWDEDAFLEARGIVTLKGASEDAQVYWRRGMSAVAEHPPEHAAMAILPFANLISLYTEILNRSMVTLLETRVGRDKAARYLRDCWLGKGVAFFNAHFPDHRVVLNVLKSDVGSGVPEVPAPQDGK